jgi:hypothetical protein
MPLGLPPEKRHAPCLKCDSRDLIFHAMLSDEVFTV